MFSTTKKHLFRVLEDSKATKKEKWVKDNQGQMIITAGQVVWTHECEKALADPEQVRGDRGSAGECAADCRRVCVWGCGVDEVVD